MAATSCLSFRTVVAWTIVLNCFLMVSVSASQRGKVMAFFQKTCDTSRPNPCQQVCQDIDSGGFYCKCDPGFTINSDGMTCSKLPAPNDASTGTHQSLEPLENESDPPVPGPKVVGSGPAAPKVKVNQDGEVMISDKDVVHVETVDLTKGLEPPRASEQRRPHHKTQSSLILDRGYYDVLEGGGGVASPNDVNFNPLDIPEGGSLEEEEAEKELLRTNQIGVPSIQEEFRPRFDGQVVSCDGVVCENNGTCAVMQGEAICRCPLGTLGTYCERVLEVRYPKFMGTGFLALPTLRNAHKEFRVALEFMPESLNGLLLFSGEMSDARTDFFSLVLDDGYVVYKFDCGTGAAELRTPNRVTLGAWNRVEMSRVDNHGSVQLNSHQEVEGSAQGDYTRITFRLNMYVGGFSDMASIAGRVGTDYTFVGCVQELSINGHLYDFRQKGLVGEAEFGVNVGECSEGVCDGVTCLHGGSCTASSADRHVCLCPLGHHGDSCEKSSPVHVPHFSGHSYLEFPGLQRSVLSFTELEVVFKPTSPDGSVLYNGYSRDRKGDFISLAMSEGHLEFRFDLGTGPAVIRSYEPLSLNQWHLVRASRTGLMGTLDIDGQRQTNGQAEGAYTQLTLLDGLYLGGHPNYDHTSRHANLTRSFTGCLQKVVVNKKTISLLGNAVAGVNVGPCSHPCAGQPCLNGGECKPVRDAYTCYCPIGYSNTNCEDEQAQLPNKPMFSGQSFLQYRDKEITKRVTGDRMDLQIHLRPRGPDGLVFWSGEDLSGPTGRDFMALAFQGGSLQLRYNLGSGEAMIGYNDSRLFDGGWHFVRVQRDKQDSYMEIDGKEIVEGSSPGGYTSLNTNKVVYLGGMPNIMEATGGRFTTGFVGCIKGLKLATDYDVKLLGHAYSGRNVVQCKKKMFL